MSKSKPFWKSKTFLGIAVVAVSKACQHFGIEMTDPEITELVYSTVDYIGLIVATFGRVTAKHQIGTGG